MPRMRPPFRISDIALLAAAGMSVMRAQGPGKNDLHVCRKLGKHEPGKSKVRAQEGAQRAKRNPARRAQAPARSSRLRGF